MTETFDMPMADFSGDFDIQMQPSTSDPWYQELETKMEEDGPTLFKIDDSPSKNMAISQEKADSGIEVDMEPFIEEYNAEYEMVDDEHFHAPGEIHDVELHDADVSIELEEAPTALVPLLPLPHSVSLLGEGFTIGPIATKNAPSQPSVPQTEIHSIPSENPLIALDDTANAAVPDQIHSLQEAVTTTGSITESHIAEEPDRPEHLPEYLAAPAASTTSDGEAAVTSHEAHTPSPPERESAPIPPAEPAPEYTAVPQETVIETHVSSESAGLDEPHVDNEAEAPEAPSGVDLAEQQWNDVSVIPDAPHVDEEGQQEVVDEVAASTGDPHEISEGVYIDPPPPILLSLGSGDTFEFCLFNNGEDTLQENQANEHVLLANFPTLYYENLSYIFDALRCEDRVHQAFNLAECELVLEAPDLQLTVSEDNIHIRDVTLHDLSILHDVSGLDGLLRIRLSQSPRFIYRFKRLQEEVNRLHLDVGTDEEYVTEVGDTDVPASESTNDPGQDNSTTELQVAEEPHAVFEPHHETQDNPQPNDDQDAYADESYAVGHETIYEDAHGDFPEYYREHNEDESNPPEDQTPLLALPHLSENGSVSVGHDHSTTDEHVNSEGKSEHSDNADLEAVSPSAEADSTARSEHQTDENAEPGYDDEVDDAEGGGTEDNGFDDVGHDVDGGEYEADADDVKDSNPADDAHPEGNGVDEAIGATDIGGNVPGNNEEDVQRGAEDYNLQASGDGEQADLTYGREEFADLQDEFGDEEHLEPGQDNEDPTTANTTDDSEQTHLEPAVLKEEDLQHHDDGQTESENLGDFEAVASGSTQSSHLLNKIAQELAEDSHLDPPEHAYHFEDDTWEGEFEDEGELEDGTWDEDGAEKDDENAQSHSNESSVTLSSKASKRSFDEFELDDEGYADESGIYGTPPSSPGAKRTRTH